MERVTVAGEPVCPLADRSAGWSDERAKLVLRMRAGMELASWANGRTSERASERAGYALCMLLRGILGPHYSGRPRNRSLAWSLARELVASRRR